MGSSNRLAFRRHVSKLDRAELAAFLAELWDARGLLVEHTDHRLVTTDPVTGERRFVMINPARESLSGHRTSETNASTDIVVTVSRPHRIERRSWDTGPVILDVSDLYEIAVYAVDPRTRDDLLQRHLGAPLTELSPGPIARFVQFVRRKAVRTIPVDLDGTSRDRFQAGVRGTVLAITLIAFLLVVGSAPPWSIGLSPSGSTPDFGTPTALQGEFTPDPPDPSPSSIPVQVARSARTSTLFLATPRGPGYHPSGQPLSAGSDSWSMFGGDIGRTGDAGSVDGPRIGVVVAASLDLGAPSVSSPAVSDGRVIIGHQAGGVYGLDASTFGVQWGAIVGDAITASPTVANGTVYVAVIQDPARGFDPQAGSRDTMFAIDADSGRVRWGAPIGSVVFSSPVVVEETVFAATREGAVYALDTATGDGQWNTSVGPHVMSSPAVSNGTVYVGVSDGSVVALDAGTGIIQWRTETDRLVASSPAVVNDTLYIGSTDTHVYSLDAGT